ncbi:glycosyltransferase family 2 protein [Zobellia uliginosa]|uniref:glycosyltransferase family 2 protein n=1 Tax=Zobellia uliginosa TaxID=143224 RepID=UPI001C07D6F7|nr:glycosyltransferase family 2 protein [Zobellia uliginosa]MBU2947830.1 glycosyltransferase [Zobellia uliginosa]
MTPSINVSIITVVFNGEKYLEQTINSVIQQTYSNIEYIIVDGGSTDNSVEIIKRYDNYISKWISEPDKGLYDAMNKGIAMASGELIGMINSDDWYELNALEIMVKAYLENPKKTIFHADRYDIKKEGRVIRKFNPSLFKLKYYGMTYNHPSMFITPSEYKKHNYNCALKVLSDYQFVLEARIKSPNTFFYVDQPIVNYRLDGLSSLEKINKEGFIARKAAGFNFMQRLFAFIFWYMVNIYLKARILLNKFLK